MSEDNRIRDFVQEYYAELARNTSSCCSGDCSPNSLYGVDSLVEIPTEIANFTLGCGNPISHAQLQPGEHVLDLGSGGGLDCILAAKQVGPSGFVIGVDMTPKMLERAKRAVEQLQLKNVEFREGFLEDLPVEDASIDVIISNCVINLSPDKRRVFAEMIRVLKPGGRISISDIVTNGELSESIRKDMRAWGACIAGALELQEFIQGLKRVGFSQIEININSESETTPAELQNVPIFSALITARKEK